MLKPWQLVWSSRKWKHRLTDGQLSILANFSAQKLWLAQLLCQTLAHLLPLCIALVLEQTCGDLSVVPDASDAWEPHLGNYKSVLGKAPLTLFCPCWPLAKLRVWRAPQLPGSARWPPPDARKGNSHAP